MSFQKNNEADRERARKGGKRSGEVSTARRLAKWAALGVSPEIGQQIYQAGYNCRVAQERRQKAKDATA